MTLTAEQHTTPEAVNLQPATWTIEIDTGGTFTDGYVTGGGRVVVAKTDTTPYDLADGVLACIDQAASQLGRTRPELLRATGVIRLSTTIATNTLINRTGPAVGLLAGASVLDAVGRLAPGTPLDPQLVAIVAEDGGEIDPALLQRSVRVLLEKGARVIVIALGGGGDLAERENAARAAIAVGYPRHYLGAVPVLPSHQVTPLAEAQLRIQTAVLNAYLHPVMSRFLYRVEEALRVGGYQRPLLVANAGGGTSRVAKTSALRTWGSGPAGGVAGTARLARELGVPVAVGLDVGGTSTDIAIAVGGEWSYEVQPRIEGVDVALPVLSLTSAPVGGGTIARVVDGELRLGPDSAGAQPGPACFGLGGEDATVTDAVCHLGLFDPDRFLGGRKSLDAAAAREVLQRAVAEPLGIDLAQAALRVVATAAEQIAGAVTRQLARRGYDPTEATLFATGGAGGMLAALVRERVGAEVAIAFPVSPVFSAFGLSRLDVLHSYDVPADHPRLDEALARARERAVADMRTEGFTEEGLAFRQEGEFVAPDGSVSVDDIVDQASVTEIVSRLPGWRLRLARQIVTAAAGRAELPTAGCRRRPKAMTRRQVIWPAGTARTRVYDWTELAEGAVVTGPAVLETSETTLAVPPGIAVRIGSLGEARFFAAAPGGPSARLRATVRKGDA